MLHELHLRLHEINVTLATDATANVEHLKKEVVAINELIEVESR